MAVLLIRAGMVFTSPHAFRAKNIVDVGPLMRMSPPLHNIIHVAVKLAVVVAERGVVKDAIDVFKDLVHRDFGMLPGIDDTRSDVLKDCSRNLPRNLIQDVGKVVFRKNGVSGIRTMGVSKSFILVFSTF